MSRILILDYGSQFTQLIARRVREAHVYSEIHRGDRDLKFVQDFKADGIILSGGPNSVFADGAPTVDRKVLDLGVPPRAIEVISVVDCGWVDGRRLRMLPLRGASPMCRLGHISKCREIWVGFSSLAYAFRPNGRFSRPSNPARQH